MPQKRGAPEGAPDALHGPPAPPIRLTPQAPSRYRLTRTQRHFTNTPPPRLLVSSTDPAGEDGLAGAISRNGRVSYGPAGGRAARP